MLANQGVGEFSSLQFSTVFKQLNSVAISAISIGKIGGRSSFNEIYGRVERGEDRLSGDYRSIEITFKFGRCLHRKSFSGE